MKFIKRVDQTQYIEDKTDSVGSGGGTVQIEDVPKAPDTALEVEIEGKRYVVLAYERKS